MINLTSPGALSLFHPHVPLTLSLSLSFFFLSHMNHLTKSVSQDLAFLSPPPKILPRKSVMALAGLFDLDLCLESLGGASEAEAEGEICSRIWLRMPTSSSSTWWFRAADVSV